MHFEDVWLSGEAIHGELINESCAEIINELMMKLNLYKIIDGKSNPNEQQSEIRSRALGEILFVLTKLSQKDNINVFKALNDTIKYRSMENEASYY